MIISVINLTGGRVRESEVRRAVRAVNLQIKHDFEPHWGFGATLRLAPRVRSKSKKRRFPEIQDEAFLYLSDKIDLGDAEGYHDLNNRGIPHGFVATDLKVDADWTITLSHEALELTGDPLFNLLVEGPNPKDHRFQVFHWFEMCDAVQEEKYSIDHVELSNFVLPLYFTAGNERGGRNDFLGTLNRGRSLRSFYVNPGGYIGFYDTRLGRHRDWSPKGEPKAKARLAIKHAMGSGRGSRRRARNK